MLRSLGKQVWTGYTSVLHTNPLLTKSFTSFTGFIAGDAIAQVSTRSHGEKYDYARTARFAAFGFFLHAPGCHYFYHVLDKVVYPAAATSTRAVLSKMLIDQLLWTPFSLVVFYSYLKTAEGERHRIGETLRDKFVPTLLAGYAFWPLAHIINFRFIPGSQRVLYINCVQIGWNVVLSRIATKETPKEHLRAEKRRLGKLEDSPV